MATFLRTVSNLLLNSSSVAQKRHADDYETRPAKRAKIGSTSYTTTDSAPSSELALDNLFDLLLDQKDNPLWQRNIQHVVDSALDHDAIFNTIASPLNKVLQAVERRNTDNSAAERDILTTVGNQFIAQVLQHLVDGLHDHDVDLRINPSLNWRGIDGDIHATFGAHGAGPSDEGREASPEVRILRDDYGYGPGRVLRHRIQRPLVLDSPANTLILQALNDAGSVPPDLDKDEVLETLRDALGFDSGLLCAGGLMRASVNSEDPEGQPVKVFIADFVDQKKALGAIGTTIKVDQVSLALQGRLQPHHHTFLCNEMPLHNDGACGNDTIRGLLATFPQSTQLCVKLAPSAAAFSRFGLLMVKISSPAPIDRFSFDVKVEGQPRVVYFRPLRETAASSCVVCLSHQHSTAACPLFTTLLVELPQGLHPRLVQEL